MIEKYVQDNDLMWIPVCHGKVYKDTNIYGLSTPLSHLIKTAGKCDAYNSDFLYNLESLAKDIEDNMTHIVQYFGFREYGIDGATFINARLSSQEVYGTVTTAYWAIYKLELDMETERYGLSYLFDYSLP